MPFHFCWDEAQVLLMSMPFLGFGLMWIRSKLPAKKCCNHEHGANQKHV